MMQIIKCCFVFSFKYACLNCVLCLPVDSSGAAGASEVNSSVATVGFSSMIFSPVSVVSTTAESTPKANSS